MPAINNPRVGTSTNLQVGGQYDLMLVKFVGSFPEGEMKFGFHDTPMKVTGLQKVSQTFLKILLTTKGSDPFYPNRGTLFGELTINSNQDMDDQRYIETIRDSILDAQNQTISCLNAQNPDSSSCLVAATLLGLDKVGDSLTLYVNIATANGARASIAVPFPEFGLDT